MLTLGSSENSQGAARDLPGARALEVQAGWLVALGGQKS